MKAKTLTYSLLAGSMLAASPVVFAHENGDMLLRFGGGMVAPKSNNSDIVSVDDGTSATVTFTYMFKDNWAVDVLAAWPFKHDISCWTAPRLAAPSICRPPFRCSTTSPPIRCSSPTWVLA